MTALVLSAVVTPIALVPSSLVKIRKPRRKKPFPTSFSSFGTWFGFGVGGLGESPSFSGQKEEKEKKLNQILTGWAGVYGCCTGCGCLTGDGETGRC